MKKSYHISLKILSILLLCILTLLLACNKTYEKTSIDKNKKAFYDDSVGLQESSSNDNQKAASANNRLEEVNEEALPPNVERDQYIGYYYIIGDNVRLREDASIDSKIVFQLNEGTKVALISKENDWVKVNFEGAQGYIRSDYVSSQIPNENTPEGTKKDTMIKTEEETMVDGVSNTTDDTRDIILNPKIIVRKSDRILELWDNDSMYGSYPIGLGWEPVGDKKKEGDGRTPEGTYYICTRNNYSRFYLSLGISYPNKDDADEALEAEYIDQRTHQQIVDAINQNKQPPWNTALGGEIMIHGHGAQSDWTAGCIAVENNIMDILWNNCPLGTPIHIMP